MYMHDAPPQRMDEDDDNRHPSDHHRILVYASTASWSAGSIYLVNEHMKTVQRWVVSAGVGGRQE